MTEDKSQEELNPEQLEEISGGVGGRSIPPQAKKTPTGFTDDDDLIDLKK